MTQPPAYDEHLTLPASWWIGGYTIALIVAASIHGGYGGLRAWLPYAVTLPVVTLLLLALGRTRVAVRDGELHVLDAHIPTGLLGAARVLDRVADRRVLRRPDPQAYVVTRSWVRPVVQLDVDDPADDTPYWLVSTRHPERLLAALAASRLAPPR